MRKIYITLLIAILCGGCTSRRPADGEPLYVVSSRNGAHMSYSDNTATICGEVEGASLGDKIMI